MCSCWQRLKGCSVLSYPQYLKFMKTDVILSYLLTHSRVKSSLASLKTNMSQNTGYDVTIIPCDGYFVVKYPHVPLGEFKGNT